MDFIREYDFDALPYLDQEYNEPGMKSVVDGLVAQEMLSFTPKDYLGGIPYPKLSSAFSCLQTDGDWQGASSTSSSSSLRSVSGSFAVYFKDCVVPKSATPIDLDYFCHFLWVP